ncbi:MAG: GAF domain-containing sensor histidine kinase [Polyangiales bacterium]
MLLELAQQFGATLDLEALVPLVLDRAVGLLRAERAVFMLLDNAQRVERAVTHNLAWAGPPDPLPASMQAVNEVIASRRPVIRPRQDDEQSASQRRYGLNLVVAVPVMVRQRLLGVMYIDSHEVPAQDVGAYSELLLATASLAGVAVENARLFQEQAFRHALLAWMVHEFRNPLTVILANGELARAGEEVTVDELSTTVLDAGRRIERMINGALALSRIDQGPQAPSREPMDLAGIAREHARDLSVVGRGRGIAIEVEADELPAVFSVRDRVDLVLGNLLFNALKYARGDSRVRVTLREREAPGPGDVLTRPRTSAASLFPRVQRAPDDPPAGYVEVAVHNEGPPIAPEVRARLFTPYVRGEDSRDGIPSTGLGLVLAAECARSLGGALWLDASDDDGTRFAFTIPTG